MNIRPVGERLLVKRLRHPDSSSFDIKQQTSPYGNVLRVGSYVQHIKPGEDIYFNPYSGFELTVNGETFILLAEYEVLGYYTQ